MSTIDEIVNSELDPRSSVDSRSLVKIDPRSLVDIPGSEVAALRERLVQIAVAGKSKEYFGKSISSDEIEKLDQKDLQKLYARYETCMGNLVTKSLKKHFITAYTNIVRVFLPKNLKIADPQTLEESLNQGPFIDLALNKWTCGLYHKMGHLLGPLEAVLLTSNHIQRELPDVELPDVPESEPDSVDKID